MTSQTIAAETQATKNVSMGQVALVQGEESAKAVLGSCVGLAISHRRTRVSVMAHIVLPEACGRTGPPGKFADTAIPHMLELLSESGVPRAGLTAKLAGGSEMFGKPGPLQIGRGNVEAVTRLLKEAGISVLGSDVGGTQGRRMSCSAGGLVLVEINGAESVEL